MKKILLLAIFAPIALAETPATTITPGTGIIVNCDGCDEPPIPKEPEVKDVKIVTECPKPKTIVKWKTKEVVKWKTREVVKEVKTAPVTYNNNYYTGGSNQSYVQKSNRVSILVGAPYKAVTEYEMKDEDFAHAYPLVGVEYTYMLTRAVNINLGVWSDRFLFTGLGYNY